MAQRKQIKKADGMHAALIFQIALDLLFQRGDVRQDVAVGDDDAFRFGGGAGGEHDFQCVFAGDVFRVQTAGE